MDTKEETEEDIDNDKPVDLPADEIPSGGEENKNTEKDVGEDTQKKALCNKL